MFPRQLAVDKDQLNFQLFVARSLSTLAPLRYSATLLVGLLPPRPTVHLDSLPLALLLYGFLSSKQSDKI